MGMMVRRNIKARAAQVAPVVEVVTDTEFMAEGEIPTVVTFEEMVKASDLTRTQISRMTTAKLQEVAESFGLADADTMTGSQIKKKFYAALGE